MNRFWSLAVKILIALALMLPLMVTADTAEWDKWRVDLELGAVWAAHNDVQIPNDNQGDRFDISDFGQGPYPVARASVSWRPWQRHAFEFVLAPLAYEEKGSFDNSVRFAGETYQSGERTEAEYQFNSYRLRYLYQIIDQRRWELELGGTLFVRDARIALQQGSTRSSDSNVGLVPLFALRTRYHFSPRWSLELDSDMAWAPQGRAIDLSLMAKRHFASGWDIAAGYRTIEGGADNDTVYTFAWFNAAVLRVGYQW